MNIHTDNQNNFDRHRDYTSILYLNDDYSGGETFLPDHNVICSAEKGKLLVFPSSYPHGVNRIKNKCRYTLMTWFTEDENFSLMT